MYVWPNVHQLAEDLAHRNDVSDLDFQIHQMRIRCNRAFVCILYVYRKTSRESGIAFTPYLARETAERLVSWISAEVHSHVMWPSRAPECIPYRQVPVLER